MDHGWHVWQQDCGGDPDQDMDTGIIFKWIFTTAEQGQFHEFYWLTRTQEFVCEFMNLLRDVTSSLPATDHSILTVVIRGTRWGYGNFYNGIFTIQG